MSGKSKRAPLSGGIEAYRKPPTELRRSWGAGPHPFFVIQEHDATTHHFDLRLEIGGTLASWAVPKGPSTDPREKRLAVRVEDHELEHAEFEGVIEEGSRGAGPVSVWDAGPLRNLREGEGKEEDGATLEESLEDGLLEFEIAGRKLRGGWTLVHAKPGGDADAWLLIKKDDDGADARRKPTSTEPRSVRSGRTLEEIEREEGGDDDGG